MRKIQVLRGKEKDLPQLDVGEFGFCTDTHRLFIGSKESNIEVTFNVADEVDTKDHLPSEDPENTIRYVREDGGTYIKRGGEWETIARQDPELILGRLYRTRPVNPNLIRYADTTDMKNVERWGRWPNSGATTGNNGHSYDGYLRVNHPSATNIGFITEKLDVTENNTWLALSFKAAVSSAGSVDMDYIWLLNPSGKITPEKVEKKLTSERVIGYPVYEYEILLKLSSGANNRNLLIGTTATGGSPVSMYMTKPKLEYGMVATPFNPHIEDVGELFNRVSTAEGSLGLDTTNIVDTESDLPSSAATDTVYQVRQGNKAFVYTGSQWIEKRAITNRDPDRRGYLTEYEYLKTSSGNWGDAMERALEENDTVIIPPGRFNMRAINVPSGKTITGYGKASVIRATGAGVFQINGTLDSNPVKLTSDMEHHGREMSVESASGFDVNGAALLRSQRDSLHEPDAGEEWTLGFATSQGSSLPFGEFIDIEDIKPNKVIARRETVFPDYFKDDTRESRAAQSSSTLTRVDFVEDVELSNFVISRGNASENIRTRWAKDVRIINVKMDNTGYSDGVTNFINFSYSLNCNAINCDYYVPGDVSPSKHHYINVYKCVGAMYCGFTNCTAYGTTQAIDISYIPNYLPSTGCYADGCVINYNSSTGITTHGGTYACRISGNTLNSSPQGIGSRTRGAIITDNILIGERSSNILAYGIGLYEGHAVDNIVKGNTIRNFRHGIGIFDAVTDGEWFKYTGLVADGNTIGNCHRAFYIHRHPSRPDHPYLGVRVSNNTMRVMKPSGVVSVYIVELPEGINGVTFDGNVLSGHPDRVSNVYGIYANPDCNNIRATNNTFRLMSVGFTMRGAPSSGSVWPSGVCYYSMFGNTYEEVSRTATIQTGRAMVLPAEQEDPIAVRAPDGDKYWITVDSNGNLKTERAFAY